MQDKTYILSTRPLPGEVLQQAALDDIIIDIVPFIRTEFFNDSETSEQVKELCNREIVAVFTSMNAVQAVAGLKGDSRPQWKIFCIGTATGALVQQHFDQSAITGTADDARSLAGVIVQQSSITEAVFFCGDQRREELPAALAANNIHVREVTVYCTIATPQRIEKHYDGILFFSPSAAESFFSVNAVDKGTQLFAIGNTTGDTIKKFTGNGIITGITPGKEALAQQAVAHFKSARAVR